MNPVAWRRQVGSGTPSTAYFGYVLQEHTPEVMWVDTDSDGDIDSTYRIISDERGSVRSVVNVATSAVEQTITYSAWGAATFAGNARLQPFSFIGGVRDPFTNFIRLGARDYDPSLGRWTSKDPIRWDGGLNLYEYCESDPLNCVDPSGLSAFGDFVWGGLDSLTFGATRFGRDALGIRGVDECSSYYAAGQIAEVVAEVVLTGGGALLRRLAAGASRRQVRRAFERATRGIQRNGQELHHIFPLFGHPGMRGSRARGAMFPSGGLPASIHSAPLNLILLGRDAHLGAHRSLMLAERVIATAFHPVATAYRAGFDIGAAAGGCGCGE